MRVCLIIPPSGFLMDERVFPSLGVLKVAAVLEQAGVDVSVFDLSGKGVTIDDLPTANAYGITATMPQMPAAAEIARRIRGAHPTVRLILGGPHPTLLHSSAKHGSDRAKLAMLDLFGLFDVVVCGDGEKTIALALVEHPPQLIDADDPGCDLFLTKQDLNEAPFPSRHLIDIKSYHYQIDGLETQSLIGQLGCPFGCHFCGGRRSPFLRRVRLRSTERVVEEMRQLYHQYGTRGFMFLDDELNVNPKFMDLLEQIDRLQFDLCTEFRLRGLVKSELVTAPMAVAMYKAGFRQLLIGFESGDPRMLLNMNKHATREDNTRCVRILKEAGIKVKALMSFGHPGESPGSVQATRDWLLAVQPDDFDVTVITIYPGTPYYEDSVQVGDQWTYTAKNGDRLHSVDTDHLTDVNFYKGASGAYQSFVWTDTLSREAICQARDTVETEVRSALGIPWPTTAAERNLEHTMGMR